MHTAFAAGSGHEAWSTALPGYYFTAAPTAYDGAVYVTGDPNSGGGAVWGVSEATGAITWTASVDGADNSSPAVGSSGVYVSYDCQQDYRFSLSGALIWHHNPDCDGGGGQHPRRPRQLGLRPRRTRLAVDLVEILGPGHRVVCVGHRTGRGR